MNYPILQLKPDEFPALLKEIPDPPRELYYQGVLPPASLMLLSIVGSRKFTSYGRQVVEHLISGLRGYPIGIVSGLALGIDALAHQTALKNDLYTIAVPGSGLNETVLYPASNRLLAKKILEHGGGLLTEFAPNQTAAVWTFPRRNRIMAGLSRATLLIEAAPRSGSLITARLTVDYNRELLVVPGNIFTETAKGVHQFLKLGATPVTDAVDILNALNIELRKDTTDTVSKTALNPYETQVMTLLREPLDRDSLIRALPLPVNETTILLMEMELKGYIAYQSPHYIARL